MLKSVIKMGYQRGPKSSSQLFLSLLFSFILIWFYVLPFYYCNTFQLWPKWPNTTIFEIFQQKYTVLKINSKVPLFLELEFQKLEFLISFATVALLSQICVIKKNFAVLELGKLEYHLHSTRVYQARVPFFKK